MKNKTKRILSLMMALVMVFALCACGNAGTESTENVKDVEEVKTTEAAAETVTDKKDVVIRIGSRQLPEQNILMELMAHVLELNGFTVERHPDVGSAQIIHEAMVNNELDMTADYTGGLCRKILGYDVVEDKAVAYETIKKEFPEKYNIICLDESTINNTYALVMRKDVAAEHGIETLDDLAEKSNDLVFANWGTWVDSYLNRLEEAYEADFQFKEIKQFDGGLRYSAVKNREVDVAIALTTDGDIYDDELILLQGDRDDYVYGPFYIVPLIRGDVLEANPEIADIINDLFSKLTPDDMIEMNYKATVELEDYDVVALEWYEENF